MMKNTAASRRPATEVGQQDDQDHLEDAQHETADHRARQAAEAPQHAGDEGLEHRKQAHEGVDRAAPRDEEDGGEAREEARDRKRAVAITRLARTPISRTVVKSWAPRRAWRGPAWSAA